MFCYNCGGEIKEGARFCPKCGAPAKSVEELSGAPVSPEVSAEKKPSKPRCKAGIVIAICVAAVIVLGAAAGVLVYLNTGTRPVDRLLSQGEKYLSAKEYKQAADTYTKVIDKDPENMGAYLGLADAYIGLDDMEEAMDTLNAGLAETNGAARLENKLEDLEDELVDDWMDEAEELVGNGEYKDAIGLLEQAVTLRPDKTDAVLALAGAYWLADRADDMEEAVLCGIETVPDAGELYLYLADYYIGNDDIQAAVDLLWDGYDATGSQAMMDKIEELEALVELEEPPEESEPVLTGVTAEIGLYDPDFDYYANPRYEFVYISAYPAAFFDMMDMSFVDWAVRANVDYSSYCANGDDDLFLMAIETYAAQGVDGFLFDANTDLYPAINDLMNDLGLPWMSCMAEPLDGFGNRCHPVVSYDNFKLGVDMAVWAIAYADETWPAAAPGEVGMLSLDLTLSTQLHERVEGTQAVFLANGYPAENFFAADGAFTDDPFSAQTGADLAGAVFAANPQIKYWLVCSIFDEYSDGAVLAAEQAGIAANCVVTDFGGAALIYHWDDGEDSCWKSAIHCTSTQYTEPMFFALYAFVNGDATPETLWPEWIDTSSGYRYAFRLAPTFIIEKDNYKEYLEWVDAYSGIDCFPYDVYYNGTQFSVDPVPNI